MTDLKFSLDFIIGISLSSLTRNSIMYWIGKTQVQELHGPSVFAVRAKIYGVLYNLASSIAFDETSSYWPALKRS